MVIGTKEGFSKDLQLIGVGYRGTVNGNTLTMNLGFSHPVIMEIPSDVEVKVIHNMFPTEEHVIQRLVHKHSFSSSCQAC